MKHKYKNKPNVTLTVAITDEILFYNNMYKKSDLLRLIVNNKSGKLKIIIPALFLYK